MTRKNNLKKSFNIHKGWKKNQNIVDFSEKFRLPRNGFKQKINKKSSRKSKGPKNVTNISEKI